MRATWILLALGASACADPVIELSLKMPAADKGGDFNTSCLTAVDIYTNGLDALDRVAVQPGQHEAGDEQDEDGPDRRRKKQPQRKRISAHGACASCHALGGVSR